MRFEWDAVKAEANRLKHAISFEEASALFTSGVDYLELFDAAHSGDEDRFMCIGPIVRGTAVVVVTERDEDVLRLISARFASKREVLLLERYLSGRSV